MLKIRSIALLYCVVVGTSVFSQDENKVPNPSFEILEAKIKGEGALTEAVAEWDVPRDCPPVDVFTNETKKEEVGQPENKYGYSDTQEGNNYVGLLTYSEREESPRSYIQTKLTKSLIAGKSYCVKFHVSLADLSKYANNGIGVHFSTGKIKQADIAEGKIEPQVTKPGNPIINEMGTWIPVCTEYLADGTEKYLTIGNFAKQEEVLTEKMKRPREFTQPQIRGAYYYIDEISVVAVAHLSSPCMCEEKSSDPNEQLRVVYTKNTSENSDLNVEHELELNKVFFESGRYNLTEQQKASLARLIELMNLHSNYHLEIAGHCDETEVEMYSFDIAEKRAKAIFDYLFSKGISTSRLTFVSHKNLKPDATGGTAQAKAQNRRVEFIATKK